VQLCIKPIVFYQLEDININVIIIIKKHTILSYTRHICSIITTKETDIHLNHRQSSSNCINCTVYPTHVRFYPNSDTDNCEPVTDANIGSAEHIPSQHKMHKKQHLYLNLMLPINACVESNQRS